MNKIEYSNWTFTDADIVSGSVAMKNAMMFDSLNPDELTVEVISKATGTGKVLVQPESGQDLEWYTTVDNRGYVVYEGDIRKSTYGTPVLYYYDGVLKGKFYLRSIERLSIDHFRIDAVSYVGLLVGVTHLGGIYTGETAGEIINDILTTADLETSYTIDPDVEEVQLFGHLPVASCRDNLQQVLFAIGASVLKDANGNPRFAFLTDTTPLSIPSDRIYIGGRLSYNTPATKVYITEHAYYQSTTSQQVTLFDNTDDSSIDHKLVTFDEPCYSLSKTGSLTIDESGANYAYLTGKGKLLGYKYAHSKKIFSVGTGASGEPKEAKVEKATLVSYANSANVASRVRDYESKAEEVACGIVLSNDDVKPTKLISFTDPYGESSQGIVSSMDITMSGKAKADCTVIKDYTPAHFGNYYQDCTVIYSSGEVLANKSGRLIIVGGGQAGQNGTNGTDADSLGNAGVGGVKGVGGNGGKIKIIDLPPYFLGKFTVTIGTGGVHGNGAGAMGNNGGDTTVVVEDYNEGTTTTYSSGDPDGMVLDEGFYDIFTGYTVGLKGLDGADGGKGGGGYGASTEGDGISYKPNYIWAGSSVRSGGKVGNKLVLSNGDYGNGGSGGGAAYGQNGSDGGDAYIASGGNIQGGVGGNGANASVVTDWRVFGGQSNGEFGGCGGYGGCGGGGGGAGGHYERADRVGDMTGGTGGSYSNGGNGIDGVVLWLRADQQWNE